MTNPVSMEAALSSRHRDDFEGFAQSSCGDLIDRLADAINVPIVLFDFEGKPLAGKAVCGDDADSGGTPEGARLAVSIEFEDTFLGSLTAFSGDKKIEPLIQSLAENLESGFGLEQDVGALTDRLSHSYDVTNLLQSYMRNLRPNESLGWNARRLLEETAALLDHRLLLQWIPEHECLGWSAGPGLELSNRMRWLTASQLALDGLLDELSEVPGINNPEKSFRHRGSMQSPDGQLDYLILPVKGRQGIVGFAGLVKNAEDHSFETTEIRLLECLVEELTNTSTNRELHFEMQKLLFSVMKSLVAALEAKDEYTHGHSERVCELSVRIAERLQISRDEIQNLTWAALLHDIGKIGIDERILKEPGRLTEEDFDEIRTHPAKGSLMLEPIQQLGVIVPGIRSHHERFDGEGYPDGLVGEGIPLMARIIAVADTFDAVVSVRPYRPARSVEEALDVIRQGAGTQFDPMVAQTFLDLAAEGAIVPAETRDRETVSS